jgi:ATP-dependent DNA helicase RecG
MPEFRAANLIRDGALLEQARQEAFATVREDPRLAAPGHQAARSAMIRRWQARLDLGSVS